MATRFETKTEAVAKANEINSERGFNLYNAMWVGDSMVKFENVNEPGWYILNKESRKWL